MRLCRTVTVERMDGARGRVYVTPAADARGEQRRAGTNAVCPSLIERANLLGCQGGSEQRRIS